MAIAYLDSDAPVVMRMRWSDVTGGQARRALVGPDHSHVRVCCLVRTRRAHPVCAREQGRDMQAHKRVPSRMPFLSAERGVCGVRSLDVPALQHVSTRVLQAFLTSLEVDQSGAPPTPFVRIALADGDESNACEVHAPVLLPPKSRAQLSGTHFSLRGKVIENGLLLDLPLPVSFPPLRAPTAVALFDVSLKVLSSPSCRSACHARFTRCMSRRPLSLGLPSTRARAIRGMSRRDVAAAVSSHPQAK